MMNKVFILEVVLEQGFLLMYFDWDKPKLEINLDYNVIILQCSIGKMRVNSNSIAILDLKNVSETKSMHAVLNTLLISISWPTIFIVWSVTMVNWREGLNNAPKPIKSHGRTSIIAQRLLEIMIKVGKHWEFINYIRIDLLIWCLSKHFNFLATSEVEHL